MKRNILLTEKAAKVILQAQEQSHEGHQTTPYVRVGAIPGGCSGYKYAINFAQKEDQTPEDSLFEAHGISVLVNQTCLEEVLGSVKIDYQDSSFTERGFVFLPLEEHGMCGCGKSFTPLKEEEKKENLGA